MGSNFSKIKTGSLFTTPDGESYRKTSELTFDDMAGIEHYIDPFFDKKIGVPATAAKSGVDTSARIVAKKPAKKAAKKKSAKKSSKKKK